MPFCEVAVRFPFYFLVGCLYLSKALTSPLPSKKIRVVHAATCLKAACALTVILRQRRLRIQPSARVDRIVYVFFYDQIILQNK